MGDRLEVLEALKPFQIKKIAMPLCYNSETFKVGSKKSLPFLMPTIYIRRVKLELAMMDRNVGAEPYDLKEVCDVVTSSGTNAGNMIQLECVVKILA